MHLNAYEEMKLHYSSGEFICRIVVAQQSSDWANIAIRQTQLQSNQSAVFVYLPKNIGTRKVKSKV